MHSQHMSDDQPKDAVNKALLGRLVIKTPLAYSNFVNRHPINVLPKGMYEARGVGARTKAVARGSSTRTRTPAAPAAAPTSRTP